MMLFSPDILVEVTRACDRMCRGCYAPNIFVRSTGRQQDRSKFDASVFLDPAELDAALKNLCNSSNVRELAIRGGEPTLHPRLAEILRIAATYAQTIFLETHGRWLATDSADCRDQIIGAIRETDAVIKLSYDRMHRVSAKKMMELIHVAETHEIRWTLAITEESECAALSVRNTVEWAPDNQIFFQRKVSRASELIRPRLGTITSVGRIQARPTNKFGARMEVSAP